MPVGAALSKLVGEQLEDRRMDSPVELQSSGGVTNPAHEGFERFKAFKFDPGAFIKIGTLKELYFAPMPGHVEEPDEVMLSALPSELDRHIDSHSKASPWQGLGRARVAGI